MFIRKLYINCKHRMCTTESHHMFIYTLKVVKGGGVGMWWRLDFFFFGGGRVTRVLEFSKCGKGRVLGQGRGVQISCISVKS